MADKKKTNKKTKDNELDFDDLDDFDDIQFEDDDTDDRKPNKSQVAKELAKEGGKGFLEGLVKQTSKQALPDAYTENYYDAMDLVNFTSETFDKNRQKVNRSLTRVGREVKKILPFKVGLLDKYLEKQAQASEESRQQSEEEIRNTAITSELNSLFDKQIEIQKALEAKRDAEGEVKDKEKLSHTKLSIDILKNIDINTANTSAFNLQITRDYYKKSLELQFKSYFVQADMLKTMRDYYKGFTQQFTNIEKNTSLPDVAKILNNERIIDSLKQRSTKAITDSFSNSRYMDSIKKRIAGFIDEKVSNVTDTLDMTTDVLSGINDVKEAGGGSGGSILGSMASSFAGNIFGEKAGTKLGNFLKDKTKDNKAINSGANYLAMLGNNPVSFFKNLREKVSDKADQYETEEGPAGFIKSKVFGGMKSILDLTTPEGMKTDINTLGYLDHDKPAIFDRNVHRSITETIPMYLSNILKQNTDLTLMYHKVNTRKLGEFQGANTLEYDFQNRKLDTRGNIVKSIQDNVLTTRASKRGIESVSARLLSESRNNIDNNKDLNILAKTTQKRELDNKAEKLLSDYLTKASEDKSIDFNVDTLINNYENNKNLKNMVDKNSKLKSVIDLLRSNMSKDVSNINSTLSDSIRVYPIEPIKALLKQLSIYRNAEVQHIVDDKTAETISKAFFRFHTRFRDDVSIKDILNKKFLLCLTTDDLSNKEVQTAISIFYDDCKYISYSDDISMTTSVDLLFSLVNKSIRNMENFTTDTYSKLNDLYGNLTNKKLTPEQIIEGKLTSTEVNYATMQDIAPLTNRTKDEIQTTRRESTFDVLTNKIINSGNDMLGRTIKAVRDTGGNPLKVVELAIEAARSVKTSVSDKLADSYKESTGILNNLTSTIDNALNKGKKAAIQAVLNNTEKLLANLEKNIELQKIDLDERIRKLEEANNEVVAVLGNNQVKNSTNRELSFFKKTSELQLKALMETKTILTTQKNKLTSLNSNQDSLLSEGIKDVYNTIKTSVENARKTLKELEEEGRRLSSAV